MCNLIINSIFFYMVKVKPKKYTGNLRVLHFAGNLQANFFKMLRF